jgi:hypothetical protein
MNEVRELAKFLFLSARDFVYKNVEKLVSEKSGEPITVEIVRYILGPYVCLVTENKLLTDDQRSATRRKLEAFILTYTSRHSAKAPALLNEFTANALVVEFINYALLPEYKAGFSVEQLTGSTVKS